jgi:hypothetical protein
LGECSIICTASRKAARIGLIGLDLFLLDIDHIILVIKLAHLTQELLKLLTAILTHLALELIERLVDRRRRADGMLDIGL